MFPIAPTSLVYLLIYTVALMVALGSARGTERPPIRGLGWIGVSVVLAGSIMGYMRNVVDVADAATLALAMTFVVAPICVWGIGSFIGSVVARTPSKKMRSILSLSALILPVVLVVLGKMQMDARTTVALDAARPLAVAQR